MLANGIGTAVSTHSRPKAAGDHDLLPKRLSPVSTHSRPKAAGVCATKVLAGDVQFQLTAARRRLEPNPNPDDKPDDVSTHSRPKAAGRFSLAYYVNHSRFQLTAARRRLG